jgi:hypothetical protein
MSYSEQAVERAFLSMCHDPRRYEKILKEKDVTEFDQFSMKIEVEARQIEIILHCKDPSDLVFIAGWIVTSIRKLDCEPTVKVLP